MAYEWIAGLVGVAGVTVGGAGIVFTWLTDKGRLEHERTMAREAREQDRLGTTYVRLLGMAERTGRWAQMVKPMPDTNPGVARPIPELDEQVEVVAAVNAFGSDEVRQALEAWRKAAQDIIAAVRRIDRELHARYQNWNEPSRVSLSEVTLNEVSLKLHQLRPVELEARETLARQVNKELRAGRPGAA